ncbi:MAG: amidohydrolase family protein [Alphaproteobacteria bacterium]|nr:amidohydrolase family protein [Alphaproteobacteria bacterium]
MEKVIDFRVRPPLRGFLDLALFREAERRDRYTRSLGFEPAPSAVEQSIDLLITEMDTAGVTTGIVVGRHAGVLGSVSNADVVAICDDHPDRFIGVASIDPTNRRKAVQQIEDALTAGLKAVNIEPGAYPTPMFPDDRRLYPIYAHCEDASLPVLMMAGGNAGPDIGYSNPETLDHVLVDFPDLNVILTHGGWPWVNQVLHLAMRRPNLYLSPDMYLANMPGMEDYVKAANGFLADRFIFASSYPFCPVAGYADWYRALPLSDDAREKTMYANAARLLGVEA